MFDSKKPDLVILDLMMPKKSGDSKRDIIEMEERLRDMETQMNTLSGEALEQLLDTYHKLSHEFEQVKAC